MEEEGKDPPQSVCLWFLIVVVINFILNAHTRCSVSETDFLINYLKVNNKYITPLALPPSLTWGQGSNVLYK